VEGEAVGGTNDSASGRSKSGGGSGTGKGYSPLKEVQDHSSGTSSTAFSASIEACCRIRVERAALSFCSWLRLIS
jgi:hypothetical protein